MCRYYLTSETEITSENGSTSIDLNHSANSVVDKCIETLPEPATHDIHEDQINDGNDLGISMAEPLPGQFISIKKEPVETVVISDLEVTEHEIEENDKAMSLNYNCHEKKMTGIGLQLF